MKKISQFFKRLFGRDLLTDYWYIAEARSQGLSILTLLLGIFGIAFVVNMLLIGFFGPKNGNFLLVFLFVAICVMLLFSIRKVYRTNRFWDKRWSYFIDQQALAEYRLVDGKKRVLNSAKIYYANLSNDTFVFKIYTNGGRYTAKSQNLELELMSFLNLKLIDKIIDINNTEYIFENASFERTILDSQDLMINNLSYYQVRLNNQFIWNVAEQPHALVTGGTGSGKSVFLRELILKIKLNRGEVFVLDPKRSDLYGLGKKFFPNHVADTPNQIIKVLRQCVEFMNKRYEEHIVNAVMNDDKINVNAKDLGLHPIFIIFDEVASAMSECDRKQKTEMNDYLKQLIMKGRQSGIFVILTTQRPDAEVIGGDIRDNLEMRVALGNMSNEGYRMVFGDNGKDLLTVRATEKGVGYIELKGVTNTPQLFKTSYWTKEFELEYIQMFKETLESNIQDRIFDDSLDNKV